MFENSANNQAQPTKEPEDIFFKVDKSVPEQNQRPAGVMPPLGGGQPSVKPYAPPMAPMPAAISALPSETGGGKRKMIIIVIIALLVIAFLVLAGWLIYAKYFVSSVNQPINVEEINEPVVDLNINSQPNVNEPLNLNEQPQNINEPVAAVDSDSDGLTDAEEQQLGTNPNSADSDLDGLFDNEEVKIYKTNPLNPDTDGDGYKDGAEVQGGYNPLGPGRLFSPQQ